MDEKLIKKAVYDLLKAIGENPEREGLKDTPQRVAKMYSEILSYPEFNYTTFEDKYDDLVMVKNIEFCSMCEHHLLPFYGIAHIAYIPNGEVVGISKLARTVEVYAKRLQIQERMTSQIADALMDELKWKGVMVMLEAEHLCVSMRGIKKPGSQTVSFVCRGVFEENTKMQEKFLQIVKR